MYAVSQTTDPAFPQGNQLHTLTVARDDTLAERTPPVIFSQADVPANAHPQGLAVVALSGNGRGNDSDFRHGQRFAAFDFGDDSDVPVRGRGRGHA